MEHPKIIEWTEIGDWFKGAIEADQISAIDACCRPIPKHTYTIFHLGKNTLDYNMEILAKNFYSNPGHFQIINPRSATVQCNLCYNISNVNALHLAPCKQHKQQIVNFSGRVPNVLTHPGNTESDGTIPAALQVYELVPGKHFGLGVLANKLYDQNNQELSDHLGHWERFIRRATGAPIDPHGPPNFDLIFDEADRIAGEVRAATVVPVQQNQVNVGAGNTTNNPAGVQDRLDRLETGFDELVKVQNLNDQKITELMMKMNEMTLVMRKMEETQKMATTMDDPDQIHQDTEVPEASTHEENESSDPECVLGDSSTIDQTVTSNSGLQGSAGSSSSSSNMNKGTGKGSGNTNIETSDKGDGWVQDSYGGWGNHDTDFWKVDSKHAGRWFWI